VRRTTGRMIATAAVASLLLAGCQDGQDPDEEAATAPPEDTGGQDPGAQDPGELPDQGLADPNEDVEDGVYRGNGVVLPVPDDWTLDPTAFAQGVIAAVSEDGAQSMTAQAIDTGEAESTGTDLDLDTLLDSVRSQLDREAEVDEDVDLAGADRAHRLTYLELPPQQEGAPEVSVTVVLAEDGEGLVGEFTFSAAADEYDDETADLLLAQAGFDPDSEPVAPAPPPAPGG
jgi:hypothetical protein